jgi:recombination protein RecT
MSEKKTSESMLIPINQFRAELSQFEQSIMRVLKEGAGITPEKFLVTVENMIRKNDKLLQADRPSLFAAILTSAEFGLEPNTPAGLSWIIPRKDSSRGGKLFANWQLGYQGARELLYRHPRVKKVEAELVFRNDVFEYHMKADFNWHFRFQPAEGDRGERRGCFAVIHIEKAEPIFKYLSAQQISEIKAKSKQPENYLPSNDPEGWMWKKAAIFQAAKTAPKAVKVQNAISIDSMIEGGAAMILDESGRVLIQKSSDKSVSEEKINIVFGGSHSDEYIDITQVE